MPLVQKYNKKVKRWIKMKRIGSNYLILDAKQREPKKPFKGVEIIK